jgi:hypothetical protein
MHPALPVNDQDDLAGVGIYIHDDFLNECSNEAFLQSEIGVRTVPDGLQVRGQILELVSGGDYDLTLALDVPVDAVLDFSNMLQRLIPAPFQFVSHQAILGVGGIVLLLRSTSRVPRCLQLARPRVQSLILLMGDRFTRDDGSLDRGGLYDL